MLTPGALLQNRYHILRQIGGGGMGVVYQAEDNRLPGRHYAIKEMSPTQLPPQDRHWAIDAFQQEATILANLNHPGLTDVTDFFSEGKIWYLVMEYVAGQTLRERLEQAREGRLSLNEALDIARQLCEVLDYLHGQSPPVVFRDLKPDNVMITPQGEIRLIDFGIARFFKPGQTRDTINLGTPGYAAPEQYGGRGQSDPRADVYSLGALLLQMVTGYDPVTAVTPFPLPPPGSLRQGLPVHVEQVISQATQLQPERRQRSVKELRRALFPSVQTVQPSRIPTQSTYGLPELHSQALAKWRKAAWLGLGGAGVVFLGLCMLLISGGISLSGLFDTAETPTPLPTATTVPRPTATPSPSLTPTITATPTATLIAPTLSDQVFIPAGTFTRGSTRAHIQAVVRQLCPGYTDPWCKESSFEDELPKSEMRDLKADVYYADSRETPVDGFYIDRYEVTNASYARCVEAGVCAQPPSAGSNPRHSYFADPKYAGYPVVYVTWYDAQGYCTWIGGRLPAAAEWEKAARGTDGRWWPWGDQPPTTQVNFRRPGESAAQESDPTLIGGDAAPSGIYPGDSSIYGVMDLAGNVMEWVNDEYNSSTCEIRGGSWNTGSFTLRAANRVGANPGKAFFDVGFRCAYDARP